MCCFPFTNVFLERDIEKGKTFLLGKNIETIARVERRRVISMEVGKVQRAMIECGRVERDPIVLAEVSQKLENGVQILFYFNSETINQITVGRRREREFETCLHLFSRSIFQLWYYKA